MFRQCRLPQPSPIQPLSGVKFRFSSRPSHASMQCLCRPAWACFFFTAFSVTLLWFSAREKPDAFPQEKTDTSYPRASLGSCLWQLLLTTGPHSSNRAGNPFFWCRSPTRPPKLHKGPHRGEFGSHFLFLVRFFCGSPSNWRSRW